MSIAEFYKRIGKEDKDALVDLHNVKPIDFISTGSWIVNGIIGDGSMTGKPGGFPRGHISELFGDESSGKSTLLYCGIRECQEMGLPAVLLDYEETFHTKYAQKLGVNTDKNKLLVWQPRHFQQGARIIRDALVSLRPGIIGVDSVAAMTPRQYIEGEIDEAGRPGMLAQLMSTFLSIITKDLKASNTALVFTNQLRKIIKMDGPPGKNYGPTEESTGGMAFKFYVSLRLKMMKGKVERVDRISRFTGKLEKEPINVTTRCSVVKNKIDKPHFTAPIYIKFGEGIDNIQSIIELACNSDVIKRNGTMYSFNHGGEPVFKVTGKAELWKTLNESPKVFKLLQDSLVFVEDKNLKTEYPEDGQEEAGMDDLDAALEGVGKNFVQKQAAKKEKATDAPGEDD